MGKTTSALDLSKLFDSNRLLGSYREKKADPKVVSLAEAKRRLKDADAQDVLQRIADMSDRPIELAERLEQVGTPGTLMRNGDIRMEQSTKARPFTLRGKQGRPGDLEDYYRTDPVIRDSVDSVVEVQMGVKRRIKVFDDDLVPDEHATELDEWCDQLNAWFFNVEGGFNDSYVFPATQSTCIFGFAPFEIVWVVDDDYQRTQGREGLAWPVKFGYRETSTVEEWLMNQRQDDLLGAYFETGGDTDLRYTLTHTGTKLTDQRLLLSRIAGRGNNWEGISPIRPAIHWIRFKRLLGQLAAVAAQKYGGPTTFLYVDPALVDSQIASTMNVSEDDIDEAIDQFDAAEAVEAGVYYLPPPLNARIESPQGTMPKLEDMIRYCDEMITRPFSNEGSLLGHNHVGSYALAQVSENKFLRSAPAYDRVIMAPINELIRKMTIQRFGKKLPVYPQMSMKLDAAGDVKALIESISSAMAGVPMTEWPKGLQAAVLEAANLAPDALEPEPIGVLGGGEPQEVELQGSESDAPDSTKLIELTKAHEAGEVSTHAARQILKASFDFSEEEARAFFADKSIKGAEEEKPELPALDLAEASPGIVRSLEEFKASAEDLQHFMDEAEGDLGAEWEKIANEQADEFEEVAEGLVGAVALAALAEELTSKYRPRYMAAAERVSGNLQVEGVRSLLRGLGFDAPDAGDMRAPDLPAGLKEQVEVTLMQAAREANNRNVGKLVDEREAQIDAAARGVKPTKSKPLARRTTTGIAAKITGRSFNAGRDAAVQNGVRQYEEKTGQAVAGARNPASARGEITRSGRRDLKAVRSSMLDNGVCRACEGLDFEKGGPEWTVGTAGYYNNLPPKHCHGMNRCRCVMLIDAPEEIAEEVREYVGSQLVI